MAGEWQKHMPKLSADAESLEAPIYGTHLFQT